ncbi:protein Atg16l2-like [Stigmatopora argus]
MKESETKNVWKAHVICQLRRRDREQHHNFRELVHAYSRLLERSGVADAILAAAGRRSDSPPSLCGVRLKRNSAELAYQAVEKQQILESQEMALEAQRERLALEERRRAEARHARRQLRLGAERQASENGRLKGLYDALMERRRLAERLLRQEEVRGGGLLDDLVSLKRHAAARLNRRNDRRASFQDVHLLKDLQTAATSKVNVESSVSFPHRTCSTLKKRTCEKSPGRLSRSVSAPESSPKILASFREFFERRRGQSSRAWADDDEKEEEPARPFRIPTAARLPARALHVLEAHEQDGNTVAFCSSSALLASGGTDRVVKIWEVQAGTLRHRTTLDGSTGGLTCVQFDPAGHRILAGSYDKSALLWCLDRPVAKLTLTGHGRKVTAARFSRHQVLTASADGSLRMWDPQRAACVHLARVASCCSDAVCLENVAISGHFDHYIRFWDSRLSGCVHRVSAGGKVTSLDLSADGRHLLSCCRDDVLRLLDLRRWSEHSAAFRAEGFKCTSDSAKVAVSPDARYVAAGSTDGAVYVWNVSAGTLEARLGDKHSAPISAVCWSTSGEYVASVDKKGRAVLWSDI